MSAFKSISYHLATLAFVLALLPAPVTAQINIDQNRIQFPDGSQQSSAGTVTSARTVTVNPVIGNTTASGTVLQTAIDTITSDADATAAFPYLVILEPGTYDIGNANLTIPSFVNLRGAGIDATIILGDPISGGVIITTGTTVLADFAVEHTGAAGTEGRALRAVGTSIRVQNIRASVTGTFNAAATLVALGTGTDCDVVAIDSVFEVLGSSAGCASVGVGPGSNATFTGSGLRITSLATGGTPVISSGLFTSASGDVLLTDSEVFSSNGSSASGAVHNSSTSTVIVMGSRLDGGAGNALFSAGSSSPLHAIASQLIGTRTGAGLKVRNCVNGSFNAIP